MHPWRALHALLLAIAALVASFGHPAPRRPTPHPTLTSGTSRSSSVAAPAESPPPSSVTPAAPTPRNIPIPVLMYHVIGTPGPNAPWHSLYVAPPLFTAQMRALHAAGYQPVTLAQAFAIWDGVAPVPAHPVVLSFDDGYAGDATFAAPVLAAYGWPGVLCQQVQRIGFPGGLTKTQIRSMLASGWELADHGVAQPEIDLTTATPAIQSWEVVTSRHDLQQMFGTRVNFFCYPVGHYDPAVVHLVQATGFVGALTTVPGAADPTTEGALRLDRIRVSAGESPAVLLAVLRAAAAAPPPAPPNTVTVPAPARPRPSPVAAAKGEAAAAASTRALGTAAARDVGKPIVAAAHGAASP